MSSDKYYITGGAGFIGRHFNSLLTEDQVINIDLRIQRVVENQILGDIRNEQDIRDSISDSNIIIHLAASHYDFEKDYFETNVKATKKLLDIAGELNINRFVFYSSVAVYGTQSGPADEDSELTPDNDYGKSKLEAEKLVKDWVSEKPERKALIIRPSVIFGPHNFGNLFNLTRNLIRGTNFQIGNEPVIKSIAYVENLVEATRFLIQRMDNGVQIFNYVDEPQLSNFEISNIIGDTLGKKRSFKLPYSIALLLGYAFDAVGKIAGKELLISVRRVKKFCTATHFLASKIREAGFKPRYTSKEGLVSTTQWIKENKPEWEKEHEQLKKLFKSNYGITIE